MPEIIVTDRSGSETSLNFAANLSLMEAIRDSGIDEMAAICGGCCSCATCHVYVDQPYFSKLNAMSEDESDLLDSSEARRDSSRLSCQILLTDEMSGMRVTIAPED